MPCSVGLGVIKKGKIEPVARGCGVSKPSVYVWLERSQEALREGLEPHKRGPNLSLKGYSPVQLEGLNVSLNGWSDLLYSGDKASLKEALFLSGRVKKAIFSEGGT